MNSIVRRMAFTLAAALSMVHVAAAEMNMRVLQINDHLTGFYIGRPAQAAALSGPSDWAHFGAINVGVATYVIHHGDRALIYDTFPSTEPARWIRSYLTKMGIKHFTLVNSHWHLDHVGGNAVYADSDRIATDGTIQLLTAKRIGIEAGTEWGPPAIKPLVLPNIGITSATAYYVGDIRVELRPVRIHSDDGLVIYLPGDRILLAGDTLEDTVTFISEPEHVVEHYRNLRKFKDWNIERILPNHGNPDVIAHGGYQATLIDATLDYLGKLILRSHDPGFTSGTLEDYVGDSVSKGWVSIWWAYRDAHARNLSRVAQSLGSQPLPDLPN